MSDAAPPSLTSYQNWIYPANGSPPHLVDFSEFYHGRKQIDMDGRSARLWAGDFPGNHGLAEDFRSTVLRKAFDKDAYKNYSSSWRSMVRFLADSPDLPMPESMSDLDDVYAKRFQGWLGSKNLGQNVYKRVKGLVDAHFMALHRTVSLWPSREPFDDPDVEEFDLRGLQSLNLALRAWARDIKANFREGKELVSLGEDPRVPPLSGSKFDQWGRRENHAFLVHQLTSVSIPSKDEVIKSGGYALMFGSGVTGHNVYGPHNTLPLQGENASAGYVGKMRWFHPARCDTAVFLWLVMILTGFNYASALNIDISDESSWWIPSLKGGSERGQVVAYKGRANLEVFAHSDTKAEYHAYQIIKYMVSITKPMRRTLQNQLAALEHKQAAFFEHQNVAEMARLRSMIKSPWLYISLGDAGAVGCFTGETSAWMNTFVRTVAEQGGLLEDHPYLKKVTTKQPRKSLIEYTNETSGSFVASIAAQHPDLRSLRYYLSQRRRKKRSFKTIKTVFDVVVDDIQKKRPIDYARLKILIARGAITEEQAARLRDIKQRTRLGMGCLDPENPPKKISPDHKSGHLCRVQRCTGCMHGVVFLESLQHLAEALADLDFLQRQTPIRSWNGSSFELEQKSLRLTLKQFNPADVEIHYFRRRDELKSGQAEVLDGYPLF
ncbi:hypothetical protein ACC703_27375 [Rhizobium ruizarguesonis]|uniref:hypothetical protein n=1 Tax=Rhizobium leguminosarum TaxID=384 RepID=UPI0010319F11|nr:hypothetical protein [Rhizobium leguminosarum]QIJ40197.1 hypothetical protein G7039_08670 [Rhizobium leguminosarum]TAX55360.1 hypothetical protein ELI01_09020 [Rhizobium leguminosarum]TBG20536.1 hypothetical protein ELG81_08195 [Rhizobium leguminosarum]TBG46452.1 hypothetical protein ELG75_08210 [Rhizobium leguminosarum]TBG79423.1 hypothetical protein ELG76_08545 [Rhizobium leguminosarum]